MSISYTGLNTNQHFTSSYDNASDTKRHEREQKLGQMKQKSVQKVEDYENTKRIKNLFKKPAFKWAVGIGTFALLWLTGKGIEKHLSRSGDGKKTYLSFLGSVGDAISDGFKNAIDGIGNKCKWFKNLTDNISAGYSNLKTNITKWAKNNTFLSCFIDSGKESHATFSLAKSMEGGVSTQYINEIADVFFRNPIGGKSDGRVFSKNGKVFSISMEALENCLTTVCPNKYLNLEDLTSKAVNSAPGARDDFAMVMREIYDKLHLKGKWCYGSMNYGKGGLENLKKAGTFPKKIACLWNTFIQELTGRKCNFDSALHKLDVIQGRDNIAKSKLGKGLAKTGLFATEAIMNNTAGWFGSMALQAYFLSNVIEETATADKEDRGKVLAESVFREIGSMLTLGFSINVINKFASLRGIGMSAKQFQALQDQTNYINNFGSNATAIASRTIEGTKWKVGGSTMQEAMKNLKDLQKIEKGALKWYHYPAKWVGHICHWGRGRVRPAETGIVGGIKKFFTYTIPGVVGGLTRGLVGMFVIDDKKTKVLEYIPHKLFGKPKDRTEIAQRDALMERQQHIQENQVIVKELAGRLSQHPELRELIKQSPQLQEAINKDLTLLVAMLDEADEKKKQAEFQKQQNRIASLQKMSSYTTQGQNQNVAYA